jgi:hypothetical protein
MAGMFERALPASLVNPDLNQCVPLPVLRTGSNAIVEPF